MYSTLRADASHDVTTSIVNRMIFSRCVLAHSFKIYPFSTPLKISENLTVF